MGSDQPDVLDGLQHLGFSALEARIYAALAMTSAMETGYELAKQLGVSRSNVYAALATLARRGAVWQEPGRPGVRYRAVPFTTLAERARRELEAQVGRVSSRLYAGEARTGVWTGHGLPLFVAEARRLWRTARTSLMIGVSPVPIRAVLDDPACTADSDLSVRMVCWAGCAPPGCGICPPAAAATAAPPGLHGTACVIADRSHAVVAYGAADDPAVLTTDALPLVAGLLALTQGTTPALDAPGQGGS
ncbi:MAG: helix-turn-helix domain-containing protein [Thermaerobacter sp.]|nr:helix-turn-helix domain-containing protein [Thermaerobacter sp.]